MFDRKFFAERLIEKRKEKGVTQEELSEITGIPLDVIRDYESRLSEDAEPPEGEGITS